MLSQYLVAHPGTYKHCFVPQSPSAIVSTPDLHDCTFCGMFAMYADVVQGKAVVELGCGTGVVGITAACLGAQVVLTDRSSTVDFTQSNINSNSQLIQAAGGSADVTTLDWGAPTVSSSAQLQHADVVIGADLIYAKKDVAPLVATVKELLMYNAHSDVFLAHKDRHADITQYFLECMQASGIQLSLIAPAGMLSVYRRVHMC